MKKKILKKIKDLEFRKAEIRNNTYNISNINEHILAYEEIKSIDYSIKILRELLVEEF